MTFTTVCRCYHNKLSAMDDSLKERIEEEVKFSVSPGFQLPHLPGQALAHRIFTSTYYDTADFRLARLRITLRRRVERAIGLWQLQWPKGHSRLTLEIRGGPAKLPDLFHNLLFAIRQDQELIVIAKLHTHRTSILLEDGQKPLIEVALDRVILRNGRRSLRRLSEIELKGGKKDTRSKLEVTLRKAGGHDGDPRPKVFQALDSSFS